MRLPLWYLEIDWFNTNLGTIKVDEIEKKLLNPGNLTLIYYQVGKIA